MINLTKAVGVPTCDIPLSPLVGVLNNPGDRGAAAPAAAEAAAAAAVADEAAAAAAVAAVAAVCGFKAKVASSGSRRALHVFACSITSLLLNSRLALSARTSVTMTARRSSLSVASFCRACVCVCVCVCR